MTQRTTVLAILLLVATASAQTKNEEVSAAITRDLNAIGYGSDSDKKLADILERGVPAVGPVLAFFKQSGSVAPSKVRIALERWKAMGLTDRPEIVDQLIDYAPLFLSSNRVNAATFVNVLKKDKRLLPAAMEVYLTSRLEDRARTRENLKWLDWEDTQFQPLLLSTLPKLKTHEHLQAAFRLLDEMNALDDVIRFSLQGNAFQRQACLAVLKQRKNASDPRTLELAGKLLIDPTTGSPPEARAEVMSWNMSIRESAAIILLRAESDGLRKAAELIETASSRREIAIAISSQLTMKVKFWNSARRGGLDEGSPEFPNQFARILRRLSESPESLDVLLTDMAAESTKGSSFPLAVLQVVEPLDPKLLPRLLALMKSSSNQTRMEALTKVLARKEFIDSPEVSDAYVSEFRSSDRSRLHLISRSVCQAHANGRAQLVKIIRDDPRIDSNVAYQLATELGNFGNDGVTRQIVKSAAASFQSQEGRQAVCDLLLTSFQDRDQVIPLALTWTSDNGERKQVAMSFLEMKEVQRNMGFATLEKIGALQYVHFAPTAPGAADSSAPVAMVNPQDRWNVAQLVLWTLSLTTFVGTIALLAGIVTRLHSKPGD